MVPSPGFQEAVAGLGTAGGRDPPRGLPREGAYDDMLACSGKTKPTVWFLSGHRRLLPKSTASPFRSSNVWDVSL